MTGNNTLVVKITLYQDKHADRALYEHLSRYPGEGRGVRGRANQLRLIAEKGLEALKSNPAPPVARRNPGDERFTGSPLNTKDVPYDTAPQEAAVITETPPELRPTPQNEPEHIDSNNGFPLVYKDIPPSNGAAVEGPLPTLGVADSVEQNARHPAWDLSFFEDCPPKAPNLADAIQQIA